MNRIPELHSTPGLPQKGLPQKLNNSELFPWLAKKGYIHILTRSCQTAMSNSLLYEMIKNKKGSICQEDNTILSIYNYDRRVLNI